MGGFGPLASPGFLARPGGADQRHVWTHGSQTCEPPGARILAPVTEWAPLHFPTSTPLDPVGYPHTQQSPPGSMSVQSSMTGLPHASQ